MGDKHEHGISNNIIWNSIGNICYWGCNWLMSIAVVRISGYDMAGILSIAMSVSSAIYCISAYGVYNYQVSDLKCRFSIDAYMTTRKITAMIGLVVCALTCFFQRYEIYEALCVMGYMLYKTVECYINVIQAEEQKYMRMDLVGKSYILRGIGSLFIFCLSLYLIRNLFITIILIFAFSASIYMLYDKRSLVTLQGKKIHNDYSQVRLLLIECLPMALYWLFNTLTPTIPKLVIETYLGTEALGYYASISSPLLVITMASNFIFTPLVSIIAKHYAENRYVKFRNLVLCMVSMLILAGLITYCISYKIAMPIYVLLYGESIINYVEISQNLIIALFLSSIISILNIVFTVMRKLWLQVLLNGLTVILCYLNCNFWIPQNGLQGANDALIFAYCCQIILMFFLLIVLYRKWKKNGVTNGKL